MLGHIEVRCDRCGEDRERYTYCPRCSLYVCSRCWDPAADACLSCLRPGLPVGAALQSAIRSTVGDPTHAAHQVAQASRVSRSLAANAQRQMASATQTAPAARDHARPVRAAPAVVAQRRNRRRIDWGSNLRLVLMSALLAASLFVLPALLEQGLPATVPTDASAAPSVRREATPNPTARNGTRRRVETYVVRPGDTLRLIAVRFYGDETRWERIYQANRELLDRPDDLVAGMELQIP